MPYFRIIGFKDFEQFESAVWLVVITMGTVGFGDIVPVTIFGRMITMVASLWGAFIFTLVLISFGSRFNLSTKQKQAMHQLVSQHKAARLIISAYRLYKLKRSKEGMGSNKSIVSESDKSVSASMRRLKEKAKDFKDERL